MTFLELKLKNPNCNIGIKCSGSMSPRALCPSSISNSKTLIAILASRALTTIHLAVRTIGTFTLYESNSQPEIPNNKSDALGGNGSFFKYMRNGRLYKPGNSLSSKALQRKEVADHSMSADNNTLSNIKSQRLMGNTFATIYPGNAFSPKIAFTVFNIGDPVCNKKGKCPKINNFMTLSGAHAYCSPKYKILLENYGLYRKGNSYSHEALGSKVRYISMSEFLLLVSSTPKWYAETIYNHMFTHQICVLDSPLVASFYLSDDPDKCGVTPWWGSSLPIWWNKLSLSVDFTTKLDGTKEAFCGGVLRNSVGKILEIFYKALSNVPSSEEVYLRGVHHGLDVLLERRWQTRAKQLVLEIDHPIIYQRLISVTHKRKEFWSLYEKNIELLSEFDDCGISFQPPQVNSVAKRIAYMASQLNPDQSFPIGDRLLSTEILRDQIGLPRNEIVPRSSFDKDELISDLFVDTWDVPMIDNEPFRLVNCPLKQIGCPNTQYRNVKGFPDKVRDCMMGRRFCPLWY